MADCFDKATRSRIMRAIKSKDTKPELALAAALRRAGVQFSRTLARKLDLPGTPDFVIHALVPGTAWTPVRRLLAVFVHGCFWHLCARHYKAPAAAGFRRKMDGNRRRDIRVRRQLRAMGWRTMVVWEHEDMSRAALRVVRRLDAGR